MKEILLNTELKTSPYYKAYTALIDDEDYDLVKNLKWFVAPSHNNLYVRAKKKLPNGKNKSVLLHRLIMGCVDTPLLLLDHKDGNGLNNQKSNLRFATQNQNSMNTKKKVGSKSQYKGVYPRQTKTKLYWIAAASINGKQTELGYFNTEIEAAVAYNEAAKQHYGEFARLNVIAEKK